MWKTSGRQNFIVRILIFFVWLSTHKCENKLEASTQKNIFCHGLLANLKPWKFMAGQANILLFPWNKAPHWIARGPTGSPGRFTRWRTRGLPRHPAAFARRPRRVTGLWGTRDPLLRLPPFTGLFWMRFAHCRERALPEIRAHLTPSLHASFPPFESDVRRTRFSHRKRENSLPALHPERKENNTGTLFFPPAS